jgi:hypothetical protein
MRSSLAIAALAAVFALAVPTPSWAHCDTLDGPVVEAARKALDSGQLAPVLAWVQPGDEREIEAAFARTRAVRKLGGDAKALADTFFFETLVRVHRAGEGAPFTGLKPAGQKLPPAIVAGDEAAAKGEVAPVERMLVESVRHGLHERFARLKAQKPPGSDVAAGRAWVAAYVPFIHWVEAVDGAASGGGAHGGAAPAHAEGHGAAGHAESAAEAPAHHGH